MKQNLSVAIPAKKVGWVILERLCGRIATGSTRDGGKKIYIAGAAK